MSLFSSFADSSAHKRDCVLSQEYRAAQFAALEPYYGAPLTAAEQELHALPIPELVRAYQKGLVFTQDILGAYGKKALTAQRRTNCIADVVDLPLFSPPLNGHANGHGTGNGNGDDHAIDDDVQAGPLAGIPISIKDCIFIAGHPSTIGYSRYSVPANTPVSADAAIVRLLRAAGARLHVKTTVPTALFSLQTQSDLFGPTLHPLAGSPDVPPGSKDKYACWSTCASTGGGAALVALGGSAVEIGTDIGGSIRLPAAFCGLYALKPSASRWPAEGMRSVSAGREGNPTAVGPLARTMADLDAICDVVGRMKGWEYDQDVVPVPWTPVDFEGQKLTFGVLWSDDTIPLTPACRRALETTVDALKAQGHTVIDIDFPVGDCLSIAFQLTFPDAGDSILAPLRPGEKLTHGTHDLINVLRMPALLRSLAALFLPAKDAAALRELRRKTVGEVEALMRARNAFRQKWLELVRARGVDLVLTAPSPVPGIVRDGQGWNGGRGDGKGGEERMGLAGAGYCLLFNVLDLPAGVLPVTRVDVRRDALADSAAVKGMAHPARAAFEMYEEETGSGRMEGLPVGVQVVGARWQEERVLAGMREVERALGVRKAEAGSGA